MWILAAVLVAVALSLEWAFGCRFVEWRQNRRKPKPCVPITCPPAEKIAVEGTLVYFVCPDCGRPLEASVSRSEADDATITEWVCSEHGVKGFGLMLDEGELDLGVNE